RFMKWFGGGEDTVPGGWSREAFVERLEVLTPHWRPVYIDRELVEEGPLRLGELAVVHVQNRSEPFRWAGVSEVEGLIPLQNELNTRLSDRAHRVTMQSFNMYLAKGIESFGEGLVGPGRVWTTDNLDAQVQSFGGDGHSPSEERHIEELRSAMDKSSAVSPVVLGTVRERLGHLSSANALRITLMGVLSKAERKRVLFGAGIRRVCELALSAADKAGVIETSESERRVRIEWSDPLPISEREQVQTAIAKEGLGVERAEVLRDIGETDPGVE
ncbi:MAG: phage portal protein, partial [Planctomycetota bacterium]